MSLPHGSREAHGGGPAPLKAVPSRAWSLGRLGLLLLLALSPCNTTVLQGSPHARPELLAARWAQDCAS